MLNIFKWLILLGLSQNPLSGAALLPYEPVQSTAPLIIDGKLEEVFWGSIPEEAVIPMEAGVPEELGGRIRLAMRGTDLCIAAHCPEPGGKVLARSIGRNPVWEKDSVLSPEVEDRIELQIHTLRVTINPWGAIRIEENGRPVPDLDLKSAAAVNSTGWTVEAVIPLSAFDLDATAGPVFRFQRIRSRRPLHPEFRWSWPDLKSQAELELPSFASMTAHLTPPDHQPANVGNDDPVIPIGRVSRVPSIETDWYGPAWQNIPGVRLPRNEPYPRAPRYPTEVKWVHDGDTLALFFRVTEPEPLVANRGGRDSAVTQDDHVAVCLATTGSAFLEMAVNPAGAVRDARAMGPHITRPSTAWNADIKTRTDIGYGAWTARVDIPLEECASGLGEIGVPKQWRLLVSRYRAPRSGEPEEISSLPISGTPGFYGAARFRRAMLSDRDPAQLSPLEPLYNQVAEEDLSGELTDLDSRVWSPEYRRYQMIRQMVNRHSKKRVESAVWKERRDWSDVTTRQDWEQFREVRLEALKNAVGRFPAERPPLDLRVTSRYEGDGYRLHNLVYQSRHGFWGTANLYLPRDARPPLPAIVIHHSHHYPRTQGELQDMGMLWARAGCAVLVTERLGFGERVETTPWYRQAYASRFTFEKQLGLIGESHIGWEAWDLIRAIDLLYERPDIDRNKIILIGAVASGGQAAALAAALDARISAVVPFNYDQGHIDMGEDLVSKISEEFLPWFISASIAPRKFVRAFEFGWEGAEEPDYPNLWTSGWLRSQKIWGFYGAQENLASSHAYGLIRLSMERVSHCFSIGPQQRLGLYPIFQRWFDIPYPSKEDLAILPDSGLTVNPQREAAREQEAKRRRPESELLCITPEVSAELSRVPLYRLAQDMALEQLKEARARRDSLSRKDRLSLLREELAPVLGDIEPDRLPEAESLWERSLSGAVVEGIAVQVEDGISVPLLFIRPAQAGRTPVVIGLAQGGKDRFLWNRSQDLERLIQAGIAVCLPDVRGTGETAPDVDRSDSGAQQSLASREFSLGSTLLGARLKDLRTVIHYIGSRPDVDPGHISLWGETFVPANPQPLFLDELQFESGPQIQYQAEPLGAHLALLAALYEDHIHAVAARGGLTGYLSVLDSPFTYVPMDVMVPGILKVADIADITSAVGSRPLLTSDFVNGRNQIVAGEASAPGKQNLIAWLISHSR